MLSFVMHLDLIFLGYMPNETDGLRIYQCRSEGRAGHNATLEWFEVPDGDPSSSIIDQKGPQKITHASGAPPIHSTSGSISRPSLSTSFDILKAARMFVMFKNRETSARCAPRKEAIIYDEQVILRLFCIYRDRLCDQIRRRT